MCKYVLMGLIHQHNYSSLGTKLDKLFQSTTITVRTLAIHSQSIKQNSLPSALYECVGITFKKLAGNRGTIEQSNPKKFTFMISLITQIILSTTLSY